MTRRLLRSGQFPLEFVEGRRLGAGERVHFSELRTATSWLARFLADPSDAAVLRRLAGALAPGERMHDDRDVLARIAAALVSGRLALVRPGPLRETSPRVSPEEADPRERVDDFELLKQRPPDTHWIEIQLVGEDGRGIEGERCRIVDSEGIERSGYTDGTGVARWTRLPPGPCKVQFPDLDAQSWGEAHTQAAAPAPSPPPLRNHWLEIQLLGEDGVGIAGQRCRLVAGDGVERTGRTGPDGVARWTQLPPGACRVCFPDIDADAWDELPAAR